MKHSRHPRSEYVASLQLQASRHTQQDALRTAYVARRTPAPHWFVARQWPERLLAVLMLALITMPVWLALLAV